MKTIQLFLCLLVATLVPQFAFADIVGNYTADANTLFLLHFDEPAATSVVTNSGSKGGFFYTVVNTTSGNGAATPPTTTVMLGQPAYVNGATNFHSCLTNPAPGDMVGYDFNNNAIYDGEVSSGTLSPDRLAMTNLNIGNGGQSPFTIEALIRPSTAASLSSGQEILCTDTSAGSRGFQFRIVTGNLQFQFINGSQAISGAIPTTGNDAIVANNWYHVAVSYNGSIATLYWTLLNPTNGAAHVLSSAALTMGTTQGATTAPLIIGNENRNSSQEQFLGCIDEVRISNVARGSGQMQFYSPLVTITANPVSQNVDYNQPVTFSVGASSQFALGYQWRYNSNSIAGATNTSYVITNVAANNAGYYDCVVTNTIGASAISSSALLVVGAANFLANRYSFTTDTTDSIGGQTGTNIGNATISGGKLVLDGTSGTYMQLPPNLFNGANATALTVEFWATYGTNPNNVYAFAFGVTNFVTGQGIVGFNHAMYSPHNATGQTASATPGDPLFSQTVSAAGNLDGRTVHVAVVFDPPNKLLSIYTNGVLEAVNTNFTVNISSLNDQFSFIGRSLWAADPYLNASIDELRIFKGALSPITIKQSDDQGPNTLLADGPGKFTIQPVSVSVPAGQSATFTAAAVGYLPIVYQWFKNGTLIPGATNSSYSFSTLIGDNGSTFSAHATNIIGVTTYITNSATATLTVFIPPTLAWLDGPNGGADSFWNTTSLNWTNPGVLGVLAFSQTNGVLFDSRGSGSPNVDITQSVIPYKITVDAASDYVLTSSGNNGSLDGAGSITKLNSGKLTIDVTNNLSGAVTISGGTLQVGNSDGFGSLGNGQVTNNATLSFNRGDATLNVANSIHGSGTVSFDGGGSVVVSGASDYTGSTTINAGVLNLQSSTGLGSASTGTTIASGGQLYITANANLVEPLTINGGGDGNGALRKGGAGVTVENGAVNLASDSTIGLDGGATLVLSNVVSGAGVLNVTGSGTLALGATNTYTAGTMLNGAILNLNANQALGLGDVTVIGNGRMILGDGVNFTNAVIANVINPGAATGLLMVNDNTNGTVTTVAGPVALNAIVSSGGDFVGPTSSGYLKVSGPVTAPDGTILVVRFGNVRFNGGGSYTELQPRANTTSIGANNGIATNAVIDLAGNGSTTVPTLLDLNGFNQRLAGLKNLVAPANLAVVTNSSSTPGLLTLDAGANSYTFSGMVAGNLSLKLNAGTQILTGTNSYTGNTTVSGGTLEIAQPTLATNSTVSIASGAFLQLDFADTNRIAALVLNGVNQAAGIYNSTTSPSFISGIGSLQVAVSVATNAPNITMTNSGGNLVLTWPSDHTGWRLQVQTNSLSVGLRTNWVDVANSTSTNSVTAPINQANGAVFYRLVYP